MKSLLLIIFSVNMLLFSEGCHPKATRSSKDNEEKVAETLISHDLTLSPTNKYGFLLNEDNKSDLTTVMVVKLQDSSVVFKKKIYVETVDWISDDILRIYTRPEIVRSDKARKEFFDYQIENNRHQKE